MKTYIIVLTFIALFIGCITSETNESRIESQNRERVENLVREFRYIKDGNEENVCFCLWGEVYSSYPDSVFLYVGDNGGFSYIPCDVIKNSKVDIITIVP